MKQCNEDVIPQFCDKWKDVVKGVILSLSFLLLSSPGISAIEMVTPAISQDVAAVVQPSLSPAQDVVEETWSLIDKFSINREFGGEKWDKIHEKYIELAKKSGTDESGTLRLLRDMVATVGDKYTRILDPNQYALLQKYDLINIGVSLTIDERKSIILGSPPIPNSAADKASLSAGDRILAINGVSNEKRSIYDIVNQIAENPEAATITMTVEKQGSSHPEEVVLARNLQTVKNPVHFKISERRSDGTVVGYIRISEFNALVKAKLQKALKVLTQQGANAYVLDIRRNSGGSFQSAIEVSSLFLDDKVATYVVDKSGTRTPFRTASGQVIVGQSIPVVVWIDSGSASASEIFAGSMHDNCRAILLGKKSFGKGSIQAVYGLKNGASLALTVAQYETPKMSAIQGIGITPEMDDSASRMPLTGLPTIDTSKINFDVVRNRLSSMSC